MKNQTISDASDDPMGAAIVDYHRTGSADQLIVMSSDFDDDEIPVSELFRSFDAMSPIEQTALRYAKGKILDVGAGAGCHSLALQDMGKTVTSIDISPLSVEVMVARGVKDVRIQDFFADGFCGQYDTILMLMNGIGIIGTLANLPIFLAQADQLLAPGGQILVDSSDLRYLYEDDNGGIDHTDFPHYYGEVDFRMRYRDIIGSTFRWVYIDYNTLSAAAAAHGFKAELIQEGAHYDYLARLTRA